MKYILSIFIALLSFTLSSQCLITKVEYDHIIEQEDNLDSIVGLWYLSGETRLYQQDSLISKSQDDFLDYWYIVPDDNSIEKSFKVCHTEATVFQNFNARFLSKVGTHYEYEINYDNLKTVYADAMFDYMTGENIDTFKYIYYTLRPPTEKAQESGATDDEYIEWDFFWRPLNISEFYEPNTDAQNGFYQELKKLADIVYTEQEILQIQETATNEFMTAIKNHFHSKDFSKTPGAKYFNKNVYQDRFILLSANELFPTRMSYFIMFEEFDSHVWRVDMRINEEGEFQEIISFNKSRFYNQEAIQFMKKLEHFYDYNLWLPITNP